MKQSILFFQRISLLLSVLLLLAGCSSSDSEEQEKGGGSQPEIRLNADSWQVMSGTRVMTFDNAAALKSEGFKCFAYTAETTTPYINGVTVNWVDETEWLFSDGKHYWPSSGSLDFFAYLPLEKPSYMSEPSYSYSSGQKFSFTCTMPVTSATQGSGIKEFVYAFAANQSKSTNSGNVDLTFHHPFARIILAEGTIDGEVTVTGITLNSIKYNETFSSGNSPRWTSAGSTANFTADGFGGPFLVIPQSWPGSIDVNITRSGIPDVLSTTVATEWEAGYSYTYTINVSGGLIINVGTDKYAEQW